MKFDDVLEEIGGFGFYQKYVFALACILNLLAGFFMLNPVFLLGIPEHRCAIPGYTNDTYTIQNVEHQALVDQYIPSSEQFEYNRCHVCEPADQLTWNSTSTNNCTLSRAVKCKRWVYDTSIYTATFVTEVDLVCDREIWIANAQMIFYAGMLVGSLVSGILADKYGRKPVTYISCLIMMVSSIGLSWSNTYWLFCVIDFILGASIVAAFMAAYVISVEITSIKKRLWPGAVSNYPFVLGNLVLAGAAYWWRDWFKIQLYTALPCVLLIGYWWLIPESPRWLLSKGRVEEARRLLIKTAKWNKRNIADRYLDLETFTNNDDERHSSFVELFNTKKQLLRTLVIFYNWTAVSMTYFGLALNSYNLHGDLYLNFGLSGLVEFPAYVLAVVLVDRVGRRRLYCATMVIGGLACGSTIIPITYGNKDLEVLTTILSLLGRLCATSAFAVVYIHSIELFPTVLRNTGMCWASVFARVGSMISPYIVLLGGSLGGTMKTVLPLLIFGGVSLLSGMGVLLLPETMNKHLEDYIHDEKINPGAKTPKLNIIEKNGNGKVEVHTNDIECNHHIIPDVDTRM